jgi:hypothetical protein
MKVDEIRDLWINFKNEYKEYFKIVDHKKDWMRKLDEVKEYFVKNQKMPSQESVDEKTKSLGKWIKRNNENYEKKLKLFRMENVDIRETWIKFKEENEKILHSDLHKWNLKYDKLCEFIEVNKRLPNENIERRVENDEFNEYDLRVWLRVNNNIYNESNYTNRIINNIFL